MTKAKPTNEKINVKRGEFDIAKEVAAGNLGKLRKEVLTAYKEEGIKATDALDAAKADLKYAKNILANNRSEAIQKLKKAESYFHQAEKSHMKALGHYHAAISIYIAVPILAAVIWGAWWMWG